MRSESLTRGDVDRRLVLRSVLGALAVIAGSFLLVSVVGAVLFALTGVESIAALRRRPVEYTLVNGVASLGFVMAAAGYLALRDEWEVLHVRRPRAADLAFVVVGFVVLGVANLGLSILVSVVRAALESLFGVTVEFGQNSVITTGRENPAIFLYMIPVALFVVGPGEELVFRGVVQGLFRRVVGVVPAIVLASALFGLGHYFAISTGNAWTYLFVAGVMGLVLGGIYEYTENIAVPAAIHGIWNAFLFAANWALITYDVPVPG